MAGRAPKFHPVLMESAFALESLSAAMAVKWQMERSKKVNNKQFFLMV
jgi:hypothetical protein